MTTTHTPLPWSWINSKWNEGRAGRLFGESKPVLDTPEDFIYATRPDAAFIVRAVNHHDKMLEALRRLLRWEATMGHWESPAWDNARDIIAEVDKEAL